MAQKYECTITVSEDNGKLHIFASIPDDSHKSIAAALTQKLVEHAQQTMNEALGVRSKIEAVRSN